MKQIGAYRVPVDVLIDKDVPFLHQQKTRRCWYRCRCNPRALICFALRRIVGVSALFSSYRDAIAVRLGEGGGGVSASKFYLVVVLSPMAADTPTV